MRANVDQRADTLLIVRTRADRILGLGRDVCVSVTARKVRSDAVSYG
jgi:hypothetical protein